MRNDSNVMSQRDIPRYFTRVCCPVKRDKVHALARETKSYGWICVRWTFTSAYTHTHARPRAQTNARPHTTRPHARPLRLFSMNVYAENTAPPDDDRSHNVFLSSSRPREDAVSLSWLSLWQQQEVTTPPPPRRQRNRARIRAGPSARLFSEQIR